MKLAFAIVFFGLSLNSFAAEPAHRVPTRVNEIYGDWIGQDFRCLFGDVSVPHESVTIELTSYEKGRWVQSGPFSSAFEEHEIKRDFPDYRSLYLSIETHRLNSGGAHWYSALLIERDGDLYEVDRLFGKWHKTREPVGSFRHGLLKIFEPNRDEPRKRDVTVEIDFFFSPVHIRFESPTAKCAAKITLSRARE